MFSATRKRLPRFAAAMLACIAWPAIAMQIGAPGGPPPPPAPPPPAPAGAPFSFVPEIGTFSSRLEPVDDDFIARVYERILRERFESDAEAAAEDGTAIAPVEERLRQSLAAAKAGSLAYREGILSDGDAAGWWEFEAGKDGMPDRAWRDIDRSDRNGYAAERIGYCRGSRESCKAWFESARHRSRRPAHDAGERAHDEWRNRVMLEPCRPGPDIRPPMEPLQRALTRSGRLDASLVLVVLLNPCGDVREASFATSSRDREIDRAVMEWIYRARYGSQARLFGPRRGGYGRIPFDFSVGE